MSDQQEHEQPTDTVVELQRKIRLAIAPAGVSGPGVSILDRLVKTAVLVTEPPTEKALSRATGFNLDLVGDVLAGLVECGAVAGSAGRYRIVRPLEAVATEDELTAAWRSVELTVACPRCDAPIGESCMSKSRTYTSLHAERRKAAMNGGPSQEDIAA